MNEPGEFHWNELMTRDVEKAKAFYGAVCGWTFQEMEVDGINYTIAMADDRPAGGIFPMTGEEFADVPEHWISYVTVEDCDEAADAVVANGGVLKQAPFDVTGVGRIAVLQDPGGAMIGVIKPAPPPEED